MKTSFEKVKLKPFNPQVRIPDPVTGKPIPAEGVEVELNTYWARRLQCGDCVRVNNESTETLDPITKSRRLKKEKEE